MIEHVPFKDIQNSVLMNDLEASKTTFVFSVDEVYKCARASAEYYKKTLKEVEATRRKIIREKYRVSYFDWGSFSFKSRPLKEDEPCPRENRVSDIEESLAAHLSVCEWYLNVCTGIKKMKANPVIRVPSMHIISLC